MIMVAIMGLIQFNVSVESTLRYDHHFMANLMYQLIVLFVGK